MAGIRNSPPRQDASSGGGTSFYGGIQKSLIGGAALTVRANSVTESPCTLRLGTRIIGNMIGLVTRM